MLDAGPLGLLANPRLTGPTKLALNWLGDLLKARRRIIVPAIADYEVRRELIRINAGSSLASLDAMIGRLEFLPLSFDALRLAADYWAQARQSGFPTAPDPALDCDVILAAQATTCGTPVVVATANLRHLQRFVTAELWHGIVP